MSSPSIILFILSSCKSRFRQWRKKLVCPIIPYNPDSSSRDFIRARIAESYLDDERLQKGLNKLFKTRGQRSDDKTVPTVVLLLDGFNEITVEKRELLLELNRLVEEYPGVQVVLTSRYDMRGNFNWRHWGILVYPIIHLMKKNFRKPTIY